VSASTPSQLEPPEARGIALLVGESAAAVEIQALPELAGVVLEQADDLVVREGIGEGQLEEERVVHYCDTVPCRLPRLPVESDQSVTVTRS